ncbi:hypothetical protein BGX38DRAFT_1188221 [Terfezia claveryi]|nr:hypothetical protein BGX38DRAFT_1188221 [Terfezia claveryi]
MILRAVAINHLLSLLAQQFFYISGLHLDTFPGSHIHYPVYCHLFLSCNQINLQILCYCIGIYDHSDRFLGPFHRLRLSG